MASELIKAHKDRAEIYQGEAVCNKKIREILETHALPNGLLPVPITELGHDKASGFVWAKQEKKTEKKNERINKLVSYDKEMAFFVEKGRVKKMIGIKSKELIIWAVISDIYINEDAPEKIVFANPQGICRKFPCLAFVNTEQVESTNLKNTN